MSLAIVGQPYIDYGRDPGPAPPTTFLTNTTKLRLPINCVVAGNQYEPIKKAGSLSGMTGPMRGVFGE